MARSPYDPRLLDHDPLTGVTEYYHYHEDGGFSIESRQEITELVEINKFLANETTGTRHAGLTKVASIPMVVYLDLKQRQMLPDQDEKAFSKWLNDSDNRVFRTRLGKY